MKKIAYEDDKYVDNAELHEYEDSSMMALKSINIKMK